MHLTSPTRVDDIVERTFHLGDIPGVLWTPVGATRSAPAPLVLAGLPGGPVGLRQMHARLLARARRAAEPGLATAAIELPGSGGRPAPPGVDRARAELRTAVTTGRPVPEDVVDRLVLPLVDAAVPEARSVLDALLDLDEVSGPIGVSGGVTAVGVRLAAVEPRIAAAVLFAGSVVPRPLLEEARRITIPLHVLLQWDDEGNDRRAALELFDAFGSAEKTLSANMGGHTGVPSHAGEEANRFLLRHLRPATA